MQISNASLTAVEGPVFLLQRDLPLYWAVLYQPTIQNSILASQWMAIYYHETFPHSCYNTVQYDHSVTPPPPFIFQHSWTLDQMETSQT